MDIVKRLRKQKWQVLDEMRGLIEDTTAYEAADEIERLRGALRDLIHKLDDDFDNGKPVKKLDIKVARKALGEKE